MDNFSYSHRCTSGATLVRAALVLATPARPASLRLFDPGTLFIFFGLAPAPKACGLVLPELGHAFFSPESDSCPSYHACRWSRNMLFMNPFVKRSALNSQLTCRFGNGIVCHKNTQPVYFVNLKNSTRKSPHCAHPGHCEEYLISPEILEVRGDEIRENQRPAIWSRPGDAIRTNKGLFTGRFPAYHNHGPEVRRLD